MQYDSFFLMISMRFPIALAIDKIYVKCRFDILKSCEVDYLISQDYFKVWSVSTLR